MIDRNQFRDALARWACGVTVVAYRTDERVVATTVSAFMSLSLEPPLVLIALGPNATVRPYLQPRATFAISVLGADQKRLAMVFADPFPVGPDPFPATGAPVISGALIGLTCEVERVSEGGDHAVVIAAVDDAVVGARGSPLVRYDRKYCGLDV